MRTISLCALLTLGAVLPLTAAVTFSPTNCGTVGLGASVCLFTPSGGTGPYTFSYTPNTAPIPGFRVLNAPAVPSFANAQQTGGLGGLAVNTGVFNASVRVTDSTGAFLDQNVTFTVVQLDIGGNGPFQYAIGDTVTYQFQGVGGTPPYHFAPNQNGGAFPDGISLDPNTGILSGTIQNTANNNSHTITRNGNNGFGFNITITDSGGNAPLTRFYGMSFADFQVQLNGAPIDNLNNNLSARYLPNGNLNQQYSEQFTVVGGLSAVPPYKFTLGPGSFLPGGLTLSSGGLISGKATQVTFTQNFTVHIEDSATPAHTADLRMGLAILPQTPTPLSIGTNVINDAGLGDNVSLGFYAFGGLPPYTYSFADPGNLGPDAEMVNGATNGPNWDPDSGQLRARIHTLGTYNFTVKVTDAANNTATRSYLWNIRPLTFQNQFPANAVVGTPYQFPMLALGGSGSYTVTTENVPAGLGVDGNGILSGTPLENGNFLPLFVNITDNADNTKTFTSNGNISIFSPTPVSLTCTGGSFSGSKGAQFTVNLSCGQSPTNVFTNVTVTSGSLPPGLSLLTGSDFSNGGNASFAAQLAGVPATAGDYSFIYTVTDSAGNQGSRQIKFHVSNLVFVTPTLAPGTVGTPYNQTLDVRGGTPPYTFTTSTGSLPDPLQLNASTGTISGTPTTESSVSVGITATDSTGDSLTRFYNLSIYPVGITDPIPASPNVLPIAYVGEPYSVTLQGLPPGAFQWTVTGNLDGLTLNTNTGVLSGTPSNFNSFAFITVTASNSFDQVVTKSFTLFSSARHLAPLITVLPTQYLGDFLVGSPATIVIPGGGGTPPYTITLSSGSLPPGLQIVQNLGTYFGGLGAAVPGIIGVPTTIGNYQFTLHYVDSAGVTEDRATSINITPLAVAETQMGIGLANQPYSAQLHPLGAAGPFTFAVSNILFNTMPPGLNLGANGSITGTPTSTGTFSTTVDMTSGVLNRRIILSFTINATPDNRRIDFQLAPLSNDLILGRSVSDGLFPNGGAGPYNWSLDSGNLPQGIQLLTGANVPSDFGGPPVAVLAGSPTTATTYQFRVRVDDSTGTFGAHDATVNVSPLRLLPSTGYTQNFFLPPGLVGSAYSFTLNVSNGRAPFTFTTLPGTFLPTTVAFTAGGTLSGTPNAAGNFELNVLVKDANGTTETFTLLWIVYPAGSPIGILPVRNSGVVLPSATIGVAYSFTLDSLVAWGTPPYTWQLFQSSLPSGLTITPGVGASSALITGIPSGGPGTAFFSLLATDANNRQFVLPGNEIVISTLGVNPPQGSLPPGTAGTAYSQQLTASGGTPPYTFSADYLSDLAGGLSISPSGLISGTPTVYGLFTIVADATDSAGGVFRARYTLSVAPAGAVVPAFNINPKNVDVLYTTGDPAPAPIPLNIASTSGILNFTLTATTSTGGAWLTLSAANGATPASPSILVNPAGLVPGTYNGAVTIASAAASNSPVVVPVVLTVVAPVACSYSVIPPSTSLQSAATSSSFQVVTQSSCQWTATTATPWISLTNTSGTGNAPVNFNVTDNSIAGSVTRNGTISVQGVNYQVTQFGAACAFSLSPSTVNVPAAGGSGQVTVTASGPACQWNLPANPPGITLSVVDTNMGTGHLNVTVAANAAPATVTTPINISGQTLTVNEAGAGCTYSLSLPGATLPSTGGPVSFNVTSPAGCGWNADTGPSWITLTSGGSGPGNGPVNLNISPNTSTTTRAATVLIAGAMFPVSQAGMQCSFSLAVNNPVLAAIGGSAGAAITATGGPGCGWTASTDAPWLQLSANTGLDTGNVAIHALANGGVNARSANVTIAGQNILVTQSGTICGYSLRSPSASMPAVGGNSAVGILTAAGCAWNAPAGLPAWLHSTGAANNNGPADYSFSADPNQTGATRSAVLVIAGQNFAVTQPAEACTVTLIAGSANSGQFGGAAQFGYSTSVAGCPVNIQSYASWITVTNTATAGVVQYSVAANAFAAPRSGTIWVNDQQFTVTQDASTCAYDMSGTPGGLLGNFSQPGGGGSISINFSPAACGPPPVLVNGPAGMVTLNPITGASPTYNETYNVSLYLSFINYVRTTQLTIGGEIYTVKQTSW